MSKEDKARQRRDRYESHGGHSGGVKTKEYQSWTDMISRCYNPNVKKYPRYGGRGIKVCERWHLFSNFLADMGPCPPGLTLDRENNDGDYTPENCRWATQVEQQRNRSNNRYLTLNGESHCLKEWSELRNIPWKCLDHRKRSGWSDERALTTPSRKVTA
jgi:hypothetical protein